MTGDLKIAVTAPLFVPSHMHTDPHTPQKDTSTETHMLLRHTQGKDSTYAHSDTPPRCIATLEWTGTQTCAHRYSQAHTKDTQTHAGTRPFTHACTGIQTREHTKGRCKAHPQCGQWPTLPAIPGTHSHRTITMALGWTQPKGPGESIAQGLLAALKTCPRRDPSAGRN